MKGIKSLKFCATISSRFSFILQIIFKGGVEKIVFSSSSLNFEINSNKYFPKKI